MACSIDATVGGASANSYATIAEGTTYHDTHLYADAWTQTYDDKRCRALQMATRLLDYWYDWHGSPVNATQALLWPRVAVIGPNGYEEASDAIPTRITDATIELARQLLEADRTADSTVETEGITGIKAGSVFVSFRAVASKPIPDAVKAIVAPYGKLKQPGGATNRIFRA